MPKTLRILWVGLYHRHWHRLWCWRIGVLWEEAVGVIGFWGICPASGWLEAAFVFLLLHKKRWTANYNEYMYWCRDLDKRKLLWVSFRPYFYMFETDPLRFTFNGLTKACPLIFAWSLWSRLLERLLVNIFLAMALLRVSLGLSLFSLLLSLLVPMLFFLD